MADDILNFHNRIIDQDANHQRQRQERDDVQTKTEQPHHQKRRNHRERQGDGGEQRRAPVAQKHKHHRHRENTALNQHIERTVIILRDRRRAVIHLGDPELRKIRLNARQLRLDRLHHPDLARATTADNLKRDHRLAIKQRVRIRLRRAIAHRGKIAETLRPARRLHTQIGERRRLRLRTKRPHRLLAATNLRLATGSIALQRRHLRRHRAYRQTERLQPHRIRQHLHRARQPADTTDTAHTRNTEQTAREAVIHKPRQRKHIHIARCHRKRKQWHPGRIHLGNHRIQRIGRQIAANLADGRAHLVHRLLQILLQPELNHRGGHPGLQRTADLLHPIERGNATLNLLRHIRLQLLRRRAGKRHRHHHHRKIHIRELLNAHRIKTMPTAEGEQNEQQHRHQRIAD